MEEFIKAIRADTLVGMGTCSVVDECMSDGDLVERLKELGVKTVKAAVNAARDIQESHLEQACEARYGEDSDPELVAIEEWEKLRKRS